MLVKGSYTNAGLVKPVNQDAYCYIEAATPLGDVLMAVVCDGVGGLEQGELASATVVGRFADWFRHSLPKFLAFNGEEGVLDSSALRHAWTQLLSQLNDDIYRFGEKSNSDLGTTCSAMLSFGGSYLIAHVGDCRIYEIAEGTCNQLTIDQTLVARQVAEGLLTEEEAARHPKRNIIMQAVGSQEGIDPAFSEGKINSAAVYLMCCDGFYDMCTSDTLAASFGAQVPVDVAFLEKTCERLSVSNMEKGERDNITAIAFSFGGVEEAVDSSPNVGDVR